MRRRDLLFGAGALAGAAGLAHGAAPLRLVGNLGPRRELAPPRLVLVELKGGNDGLNTVVPRADDAYFRARPALALRGEDVRPLDERRGLHASLERLHARALDGRLGIVEGVGYPGPVLSHFKSTDIWHTARLEGRLSGQGWIGRLAEARHADDPHPDRLIHVGSSLPYALYSTEHPAVAFAATRDYRHAKRGEELGRMGDAPTGDDRLGFLREVMRDARASSRAVREAIEGHAPAVEYPRTPIGAALQNLAALIASPVECEVLSVTHGGFDTHNDQLRRQRRTLAQLDAALGAFLDELDATPSAARTLVLVTSEFGRRVAENGSGGTDHGTAGPVFVCGPAARGGLAGEPCDLEDLDERGNLRFTTDFRRVYATVAQELFGLDARVSTAVLGDRYRPLPLLG